MQSNYTVPEQVVPLNQINIQLHQRLNLGFCVEASHHNDLAMANQGKVL